MSKKPMAITSTTTIQTEFGPYKANHHNMGNDTIISFVYGDVRINTPIVRIHSACLFGEAFHSLHCDCSHQLTEAMKTIQTHGAGVIVYSYQEGRDIGLENKIKAMEVERETGCDTVDAFKKLGFDQADLRNFKNEVRVLQELNVSNKIYSFSGNPRKRNEIEAGGFTILDEYEIPEGVAGILAEKERRTKKEKLGYTYKT